MKSECFQDRGGSVELEHLDKHFVKKNKKNKKKTEFPHEETFSPRYF